MNRNSQHYRQRGRGCARNSANHYGGSLGYTVSAEPLLKNRPDLPVYATTSPSAGGGYTVDVSKQIAGMPVYAAKTTVGGMSSYNAPVAGYKFEPSAQTAAGTYYNNVVHQNGRGCAAGGGGCPYHGGFLFLVMTQPNPH